jgi:ABC-2 type transport system permease protein
VGTSWVSWAAATRVIAGKELRQRLRDRTAVLVGVVAPLALAGLISAALGGALRGELSATVAVADLDGGPAARALIDDVLTSPELASILTVTEVAGADAARRAVDDGDADVAVVLPAGLTGSLGGPEPVGPQVIRSSEAVFSGDVVEAVVTGYAARLDAFRLATSAGEARGDPLDLAELAAAAGGAEPAVILSGTDPGSADVPPATQFAPGMGILFLFFLIAMGARSLLAEREAGTLARLLAAPAPASSVVAGKAASSFVLGLSSLLVMWAASTVLLGARWGDPVAVTALLVAVTFAVTGIVGMLVTVARSAEQAMAYSSVVAFTFALLGGSFFSLEQSPEWLRQVALVTPNGWALRGILDLSAEGGGIGSVGHNLAAIGLFGAITAAVAIWRARRLVMA